MIRAFTPEERVRLTPNYAHAISSSKCKVDWTTRRGTVVRCSQNEVYIRWDGRATPDHLPIKGVEKA